MVTDRELREATAMRGGSPKPPSGIVKSMCRLYNGTTSSSSESSSKRLNRSSSFSAAMNKELEISCDNGTTSSSGNPISTDSSPEEVKKPRGLFRSWSLKKSPSSGKKETEEVKRCSPSCGSTKSADSGFSDSGESNSSGKTSKVINVDEAVSGDNAAKAVPKVVDAAVGNISSLQEGLRMKREQCEEASMVGRNPLSRSGSNLLKAGDLISEEDKARKQFYFSEIKRRYQEEERLRLRRRTVVESAADISRLSELGMEDGAVPAFSTPVRASFRSRRPRTSIEGARTPSKVDSRIRLREKKARSLERHLQNRYLKIKAKKANIYIPDLWNFSGGPTSS